MSLFKSPLPDGSPTTKDWPVRVWEPAEFPEYAKSFMLSRIGDSFSDYDFVSCPKRRTAPDSYAYCFGYGQETIFYLKENEAPAEFLRSQICKIKTTRELLEAKVFVTYEQNGKEMQLIFPYVPSTYYLYDPFVNWILGLAKEFDPLAAERTNPRPQKLYKESLPMYNYSLAAYRLGNGFSEYRYRFQIHRHVLFPWKKKLEEWLEITMENGDFHLHCKDYLTECTYLCTPSVSINSHEANNKQKFESER